MEWGLGELGLMAREGVFTALVWTEWRTTAEHSVFGVRGRGYVEELKKPVAEEVWFAVTVEGDEEGWDSWTGATPVEGRTKKAHRAATLKAMEMAEMAAAKLAEELKSRAGRRYPETRRKDE